MSDKRLRGSIGTIVTLTFSTFVFVFAGWLLFNSQYVTDQVSVWAYTPSSGIETIERSVNFTDKGKFTFYATKPAIADAGTFNTSCPRQETGSPVLGCYDSNGRIYVYDITNKQLDGIEEVTAAHETLHAVWARMGAGEQEKIGKLLEDAYAKISDPELKSRMEYYARTEPGQFQNELHSILGTEVANLGPDLEAYYGQYFHDRQTVLKYHDQYSKVFNDLKTQSETLYNEMSDLAASISARTAQYNSDSAVLSSDIQAFNSKASSNGFQSIGEFNRERAALVARTNQLERERNAIDADITTYNAKYDQYQIIASQIESLNKSIDSIKALDPTPSL